MIKLTLVLVAPLSHFSVSKLIDMDEGIFGEAFQKGLPWSKTTPSAFDFPRRGQTGVCRYADTHRQMDFDPFYVQARAKSSFFALPI
jgi:hypothetical protein